jgi:hypothetical protein
MKLLEYKFRELSLHLRVALYLNGDKPHHHRTNIIAQTRIRTAVPEPVRWQTVTR